MIFCYKGFLLCLKFHWCFCSNSSSFCYKKILSCFHCFLSKITTECFHLPRNI